MNIKEHASSAQKRRATRRAFAALLIAFALACGAAFAAQGIGADAAYPHVAQLLETFHLQEGALYECTLSDLREVMALAASIRVNVFEVIDCFYRWCEPRGVRIAIRGDDLRAIEGEFDLGGERILAILAIESLVRLETGAPLKEGDRALDMYLSAPYEKYIEIGTARYEERAGFAKMGPNLFDEAYGITVKKFFITTPLVKLELFEPGGGAIYVKVISRPKRWGFGLVKNKAE